MNETLVVIIRSLIGFFSLHIFARMLGKQSIGQLTFFDYVLGITVGSMAATLSVDLNSRAWPHWVGLATWTVVILLMEYCTIHSVHFTKYVLGEPCLLILNGQIMEQTMKRNRYSLSDLLSQLREKDVFDLTQVACAILETNGKLSVLLKPEYQGVTVQDMNLHPSPQQMPRKLVFCGMILEENLLAMGLTKEWLNQYVKNMGIHDIAEIFLLSVDTEGAFYCDLYKDHIERGM